MRASLLLALALASQPCFADILRVGPPGSGLPHTTVQSAVDAAQGGDTILIIDGTYPGFMVVGKGLAIAADAGAQVVIEGTIEIRDLSRGELLLLGELDADPGGEESRPGLIVEDCAGFVRSSACFFLGGDGADFDPDTFHATPGGEGARIFSSTAVAFERCTLRGGVGGGFGVGTHVGGAGGAGVWTDLSSVALYDCALFGGGGGDADFYPDQVGGRGGDGCRVESWGVLGSGTNMRGGGGGWADSGGDGGDGVWVHTSAQAQLVDVGLTGGVGGPGEDGPDGLPGEPYAGRGVVQFHPYSARRLSSPLLVAQGSIATVTLFGSPGDRVYLRNSLVPDHRYRVQYSGIWLLEEPRLIGALPSGTIGATGMIQLQLPLAQYPGSQAVVEILQAFVVPASGGSVLSSPVHLIALE